METSQQLVPFDQGIFATRLKIKDMNCNDLINHPSVEFSKNQLFYYKKRGLIPKEYLDQIEEVFADSSFKGKKYTGHKYAGILVDFGTFEFHELDERCKKLNVSLTNVLNLEHIAYSTFYRYRKERHIPSDLLAKINRRLTQMETKNISEEKVVEEVEKEAPVEEVRETKPVPVIKTYENNYTKVIQNIKKVVRCNGEANLNLNNISERYGCDTETFVNSIFSLVSSENYVIFTTYNNGKPVFTLGEPM